jgi:hypothetical protein
MSERGAHPLCRQPPEVRVTRTGIGVPRPATVAGVALLAALVFASSACSIVTSGGAQPPAKPPKEQLTEAIKKLSGQSRRQTISVGPEVIASASTDGAKRVAPHAVYTDPSTGFKAQIDGVMINKDTWVRIDFGALAGVVPVLGDVNKKWLHVDPSKLPKAVVEGISVSADSGLEALPAALVTTEKTGDSSFTGTIDLTLAKNLADLAGIKLGDAAKSTPFEATVDDAGNLATFVIKSVDLGARKGVDVTLTIAEVGVPVKIEKPKGAVEAPAALYELLNG